MQKSRKTRGRRDFLLFRGNFRGVVVLLALALALYSPDSNLPRIGTGMAVIALGCLFHLLIKGQLIRNVVICNEGFYGVVRHPYYFANFVIDGGFCILSGSEVLLYFFPFLFFWAYGPALNAEEKHLEEIHGRAYQDFRAIVPQILPSTGCARMVPQILRNFSVSRISRQEIKRIVRMASAAFLVAFADSARALPPGEVLSWPPQSRGQIQAVVLGGSTLLLFLVALLIPRSRRSTDAAGVEVTPLPVPLAREFATPGAAAPVEALHPSAKVEIAAEPSRPL